MHKLSSRRKGAVTRILFMMFLFSSIFLLSREASAQTAVSGTVTYLTGNAAYINLGSDQGFDIGDTLRYYRNGAPLATLVVMNVSQKSLAARFVSRYGSAKDAVVAVGDEVSGFPRKKPPVKPAVPLAETATPPAPPAAAPIPSAIAAANEPAVHGRVSLQYYGIFSDQGGAYGFSQPAATVNFQADNMFSLPLQFSMYSNSRYDARSDEARRYVTGDRWSNRIYQLSLLVGRATDPVSIQAGRFFLPSAGAAGVFDGAAISGRLGGWEAGVAGGSQPGYQNSEIDFTHPKFTAYAAYSTPSDGPNRYQGTVSLSQNYVKSALDRSFLSMQNVVSIGSLLNLYQNLTVDMFDQKNSAGIASAHLTDAYLSTTYRPVRWLTVTGSYAARRNIFFMESYAALPDSLFDKSYYHDVQLSTGVNLPAAMFISVSAAMRYYKAALNGVPTYNARYSWADLFGSRVNLYSSLMYADNAYNKSTVISLEFNRDLFSGLFLALRAQQYSSKYSSLSNTTTRTSFDVDLYYRISKAFQVSLNYEHYKEETTKTDRLYLDAGWRF